ncbi:hypothetical protein MKX03_023129 [Papaver bracteatum]|nr:hypothetical protein MKX03_023129 [Papaver bracteatum]
MDKLNSDLLLEIFTRLREEDIKSVLQCRKVCKLWRRLLGKPKIGMLFARSPRYRYDDSDMEIYYKEQPSEIINLNFTEEQQKFVEIVTKTCKDDPMSGFKIIGSCNGLVCYRNYEGGLGDVLYIFNPITGERIQFPGTGKYYMCAGFGYCHSTDTYKVVKSCRIKNCKKQFQVYTLGDGSGWRVIPEFTYTFLESGVYVNGALLWLNGYSKDSGVRLDGDVLWENGYSNTDIVAFDLADETFRSLPSPPCRIPFNYCTHVNLGSLGQHLYVDLHYKKRKMNA